MLIEKVNASWKTGVVHSLLQKEICAFSVTKQE